MTERFGVELKITRLMLLIGLMCERLRRYEDAEQIFRAMQAYRDDLPHPRASLALCFISQGRLREATQELEATMSAYHGNQMAKALLGVVHREEGRAGWRKLSQEVIDDGRDEYAINLAKETLGLDTAVNAAFADSEELKDIPYGQRVYA